MSDTKVTDIKTKKEVVEKKVEKKEIIEDPNKSILLLGNLKTVGDGLNALLLAPKGINGTAFFAIKKVLLKIIDDFNNFTSTVDELCKRYCVYDKDKKPIKNADTTYKIKPSKQNEFNKEYTELANTKIEYDFKKIAVSKLNGMPINAYISTFFKE